MAAREFRDLKRTADTVVMCLRKGAVMPRPALTNLAGPSSSRPPGRILPHARSPPAQVRDGRHVGTPTREPQGLPPESGDREGLQDYEQLNGGIDEEIRDQNRDHRRIGDAADRPLCLGG